jgi:hypothetical protein
VCAGAICAAAAIAVAVACIPELPSDAPSDASNEAAAGGMVEGTGASGSGDGTGSVGNDDDDGGDDGGGDGQGPLGPFCGDGLIDLDAGEQCDPGPGGSTTCVHCMMQCPDGGIFWEANNHCYQMAAPSAQLQPASGTQATASDECTVLGRTTHVVTFGSHKEYARVGDGFDAGPLWVGLYGIPPKQEYYALNPLEPGWAPTCSGCYAQTLDAGTQLPPAVSGDKSVAFCVQAVPGAGMHTWQAIKCTGVNPKLRVLCESEPEGLFAHPSGNGMYVISLVYTEDRKQYLFDPNPVYPDMADANCRSAGGRLVVLETREEREQLWKALGPVTPQNQPFFFWIGLSQGDAGRLDAPWTWDDGTPAEVYASPWGENEPRTTGVGLTTRAYLQHSATPTLVSDDTLAQNDMPLLSYGGGALPYVCEFELRRRDGGAFDQ